MAIENPFGQLAREVGDLVSTKNRHYGNSALKTSYLLATLYPDGIFPHQYADAMLVVRVLDKLCRLAQRDKEANLDPGQESPWQDIAGYGLIGWHNDRARGGK